MFQAGDRVAYHMNSGHVVQGNVDRVGDQFIYVKIDDGNGVLSNTLLLRLFTLDGEGTGWVDEPGCRGSDHGSKLVKLLTLKPWEPTPGREYPPEPKLIYGAFDRYSKPIEQYSSSEPQVGWGIVDAPAGQSLCVRADKDNHDLSIYFDRCRKRWQELCAEVDFNAEDNFYEALVGCKIYGGYVTSDGWGGELELPKGFGMTRRKTFSFNYDHHMLCIGITPQDEVNTYLRNHIAEVTAVDGLKITLDDKVTFAVHPKYTEQARPRFTPGAADLIPYLLHNLAMVREARDSIPLAA